MQCLDDDTVARLVDDRLEAPLRASVWKHSDNCVHCAGRIRHALQAAAGSDATRVTANPWQPEDDGPVGRGDRFGRYIILGNLGSGGLGEVFEAFDPELERKVAVKVIKPSALSKNGDLLQLRLLREARAMAKLSHPNVVAVYDVGTLDDRVFIAMELVEGLTLRSWVTTHRPDWKRIRDVLVQAGHGLIAAHDAGLIHRDFKPGNIMVGNDGQVKVLDFGLARGMAGLRSLEREIGGETMDVEPDSLDSAIPIDEEAITNHGQFMGTPGYMAPEQYDPEANVDGRVDQFAFCVTLHEALYRRRPFRGKDAASIRAATLAGRVSPPRPGATVPAWLRQAIMRGLSVDPDRRFDSVGELLFALQQDRRSRRRQWVALGGTMAATALVSAGMALWWAPEPGTAAKSEIEQKVIEARAAAAKSFFVYPPPDQPDHATAYSVVLELEDYDGEGEALAEKEADALRAEFSETLIRLGDRYWAKEGGRAFAIDYYAGALVFTPDNEHARVRTALTPGELALLRQKAQAREFTVAELEAAAPLIALAEEDEDKQVKRLARIYDKGRAPAASTSRNLEALLGETAVIAVAKPPSPAPAEQAAEKVVAAETEKAEPSAAVMVVAEDEPDEAVEATANKAGSSSAADSRRRAKNRALATQKASAGRKAFASNQLKEAEGLFHQALELDSNNLEALSGLAELSFERGRYRDAVRYGAHAVRKAPKLAQLRILLGDAHFKVLEYPAARQQYEAAHQLGHPQAAGRLQRLQARLGG